MKRLLVITYYWPPSGGSGVQRWVKFCKYLPQYGWQPVVFTPLNPDVQSHDESLLADIPECAEIVKLHIREPYAIYRRLTGAKAGSEQVNPLSASNSSFMGRLSKAVRGNFFIPDPRASWIRPSVKFLKKYLREHPVDAVVTTGPPQSMHLIGLELKRTMGLRWFADFRDPWTQMFFYKYLGLSKWADRRHRKLEAQVLAEADRIIAVSPPVRDDFAAMTTTPVELITNGFDEDDYPAEEQKVQRSTDVADEFNIVHTGLFAADGNPLELWKTLAELCKADSVFSARLKIRLAGKTDAAIIGSIRQYGLDAKLENLGYLPHDECVRLQRAADLLILPLRQEAEYAKVLPGKIFEYLAARRPVLGVGQSDGAAARVLSDSGAGTMFEWNDAAGMRDFVLSPRYEPHDIEKYSRRRLTGSLVGMIEQAL